MTSAVFSIVLLVIAAVVLAATLVSNHANSKGYLRGRDTTPPRGWKIPPRPEGNQ